MKKIYAMAVSSSLLLSLLATTGQEAQAYQKPVLKKGITQPVYALDEAIVERVFIETTIDSDRDGKRDRVHADLIRPRETAHGLKVPVIYEMSPYNAGIKDVPVYDVNTELTAVPTKNSNTRVSKVGSKALRSASKFPGYYDDYFVPRGYGVVLAESIGTGQSDGCPTTGDERETLGAKAVIDWLNGSAKAYDAKGVEVKATWSTGNVGMTGVSYDGTLPNAVATTGVKGLKTIVPIGAISSWYDYYRGNGAVIAPGGYPGEDADNMAEAITTRKNPDKCRKVTQELTAEQDRKTGDYNNFWAHRDYVKKAHHVRASVFSVHGLNDWNVKTKQLSSWWLALGKFDVPRKLWLHQGGHNTPYNFRREAWLHTLNKWFDYWLYNSHNNVMQEPAVDIERENLTWKKEKTWPAKHTENVSLSLQPGKLTTKMNTEQVKQRMIDDASVRVEDMLEDPKQASEHHLLFQTPRLKKGIRISGTPYMQATASIDKPVANLTAVLVDYGPKFSEIITRGWMDPQNLKSSSQSQALTPGKNYTFKWDLQPDDYVVKKGHTVGLVLLSSDHDYTLRPKAGTKITVSLQKSKLILPIQGGEDALKWEK
ncbi:x-prolyl-dipeptidyl aminopeptidase [Fictibacillus macauensis ZFHKF-1]|uniref:Xaa-Pro dipeptidyl-peptidase n=1 Tax=Fictibacillus macauensis ZFHKF-1 TaxID=1196324 RepID=I8AGC6_9BACL|nr:Xaa-Pro dipeptidyl-peptidase [Fictibacillus macauensis]EIT84732.1 x-prolyl-dipeptidyl aminopeptidase [Fictibacillus macauensis ZFHKF-1]